MSFEIIKNTLFEHKYIFIGTLVVLCMGLCWFFLFSKKENFDTQNKNSSLLNSPIPNANSNSKDKKLVLFYSK